MPLRQCICCGKRNSKTKMIRIVLDNNEIIPDISWNREGRGAYICKSDTCLNKAINIKILEKAFKKKLIHEHLESIKKFFSLGSF